MGQAQSFKKNNQAKFGNKDILLFKDSTDKSLIFYKTDLRINTDGAPKSYHPEDLRASKLAYNLILNAVAVYRNSDCFCISIPNKPISDYSQQFKACVTKKPSDFTKAEKTEMVRKSYEIIEAFIASDYTKVEEGYTLLWQSVLVKDKNGKPCVFKTGANKGYFGSKTAVNNGPIADKGECDCNYYLDATKIPGMVLPGGKNALTKFGAQKEDLVVAYNLENKQLVFAIIGDTGPASNLGEGNIKMNSLLKNVTDYPQNRKGINAALTVGDTVIVTIIPSSHLNKKRPYTEENIRKRGVDWLKSVGFASEEDYIHFIEQHLSEVIKQPGF
ncbi:hypothetical protein GCM10027442_41100 [Emticicia fontis]